MARLTIDLADRTHRAPQEAAVRQNRALASITEESTRLRGIQLMDNAKQWGARTREKSDLSAPQAEAIAVKKASRYREER
ncbi:CopG family transcriptional regulator [Candidatus Foliamicus sp.]